MEQTNFQEKKILSDFEANELIEEIQDLEVEYNRLELVANDTIAKVKDRLAQKKARMESEKKWRLEQLHCYIKNAKGKETKTQKKISLLSGDVVLKKPQQQIVRLDDKELLKWAKSTSPEYVKVETIESLKWAELKKELIINNGDVLTADGELIPGLAVTTKSEELVVKY